MVKLTTQLLIPSNILWLPLCRIYKFGLDTLPSKTVVIPYTCGLPIHNSSSQSPSSQPNEEEINVRAIVVRGDPIAHVDDDAIVHADDDAIAHVHEDAIACVDDHAIPQDDAYAEQEIHYHPIGDLDVIVYQQDMDRRLTYSYVWVWLG